MSPLTFLLKKTCPSLGAPQHSGQAQQPFPKVGWEGAVAVSPRAAFPVPAALEKRPAELNARVESVLCNPAPAGSLGRFPESERFLASNPAERPQLRARPPPDPICLKTSPLLLRERGRSPPWHSPTDDPGTAWLASAPLRAQQQLGGSSAARTQLVCGRLFSARLPRGERA